MKNKLNNYKVWCETKAEFNNVTAAAKKLGYSSLLSPSPKIKALYFKEDGDVTHQYDDINHFSNMPYPLLSPQQFIDLAEKKKQGLNNLPKSFTVDTKGNTEKCLAVGGILKDLGLDYEDKDMSLIDYFSPINFYYGLENGEINGRQEKHKNHFSFEEFLDYVSGAKECVQNIFPEILGHKPEILGDRIKYGCTIVRIEELRESLSLFLAMGVKGIEIADGKINRPTLEKLYDALEQHYLENNPQ